MEEAARGLDFREGVRNSYVVKTKQNLQSSARNSSRISILKVPFLKAEEL